MFDLLLPFGQVFLRSTQFFHFSSKLSNLALNRTRKLDTGKPKTRTQAHHQKMHGTPGGLNLSTNKNACFGRIFG